MFHNIRNAPFENNGRPIAGSKRLPNRRKYRFGLDETLSAKLTLLGAPIKIYGRTWVCLEQLQAPFNRQGNEKVPERIKFEAVFFVHVHHECLSKLSQIPNIFAGKGS